MKRTLQKIVFTTYHHDEDGNVVGGPHANVFGKTDDITGCVDNIWGCVDGLTGRVDNIRGCVTGMAGNLDLCEITEEERERGVDINDLIV